MLPQLRASFFERDGHSALLPSNWILRTKELKRQEALIAGAYNIWLSTAWVHEAYLAKGLAELQRLNAAGELSDEMLLAFTQIDCCERCIVNGNNGIVEIEQTVILQGLIDEVPDVFVYYELPQMNESALDPFGGESFLEWGGDRYYGRPTKATMDASSSRGI